MVPQHPTETPAPDRRDPGLAHSVRVPKKVKGWLHEPLHSHWCRFRCAVDCGLSRVSLAERVTRERCLHATIGDVSAEEVKRLTVNRVVDGLLSVRYEGDTMIVPILEEVLIVEKRCMLKEELHISKRRVETHTPQRVTVRSEEVTVERIENPQ